MLCDVLGQSKGEKRKAVHFIKHCQNVQEDVHGSCHAARNTKETSMFVLCDLLHRLSLQEQSVFVLLSLRDCTLAQADFLFLYELQLFSIPVFLLHGLPQLEAVASRITESNGDATELDAQLELIKVRILLLYLQQDLLHFLYYDYVLKIFSFVFYLIMTLHFLFCFLMCYHWWVCKQKSLDHASSLASLTEKQLVVEPKREHATDEVLVLPYLLRSGSIVSRCRFYCFRQHIQCIVHTQYIVRSSLLVSLQFSLHQWLFHAVIII